MMRTPGWIWTEHLDLQHPLPESQQMRRTRDKNPRRRASFAISSQPPQFAVTMAEETLYRLMLPH